MRIAFVISSLALAGMEMRVARLAGLAEARGHTVHFGCPEGSQLHRHLQERGIRCFPLHIHGSLDGIALLKLLRRVRRHRVDLIMAFNGKDYWMSVAAGRLSRIPVLLNRSTANPINPVTVPVVKSSDGVIAVSRGIGDILVGQGVPGEMVRVVHLGVNTSVFSPRRGRSREELRTVFGLPRERFIAGCFGRSSKGQRQLLAADELLRSARGRIHYLFAGEHIPERIGAFVRERPSLHNRVTLREPVPYEEVPDYLACLDLVVMLPEREPFSNAVLEAMAMEKPLILSRTLGNVEAVEDGLSGILVGHDDIPALAGHVQALYDSPRRRKEMGSRAGRRVHDLFTEDVMMDGMEQAWLSIPGSRDRPRNTDA